MMRSLVVTLELPMRITSSSRRPRRRPGSRPLRNSISTRRATHPADRVVAQQLRVELVAGLLEVRQVHGVVDVPEAVHITPADLDTFRIGHARAVSQNHEPAPAHI